jgi:hypothetical protein
METIRKMGNGDNMVDWKKQLERIEKPVWLRKAYKNQPWRFNKTIIVDGKSMIVKVYNFEISIMDSPDSDEYQKAMEWIDNIMQLGM